MCVYSVGFFYCVILTSADGAGAVKLFPNFIFVATCGYTHIYSSYTLFWFCAQWQEIEWDLMIKYIRIDMHKYYIILL